MYLQSVDQLKTQHPAVYQQFQGNHTVRRTETYRKQLVRYLDGPFNRADFDDYEKKISWFIKHNLFELGKNLVALDTGLSDVNGFVNCDKAEEIGGLIEEEITGKCFSNCSFKRKNQIVTVQSLYLSVKIGEKKVTIDPHTLFLRLVVMVERKPDEEITKYF